MRMRLLLLGRSFIPFHGTPLGRRPRCAALVLAAALLPACTGIGPGAGAGSVGSAGAVQGAPAQATGQAAPSGSSKVAIAGARAQGSSGTDNPAVTVYQNNGASVVNITSIAVVPTLQGALAQQPQGIGSGFVIDTDGRIVTNNHVVQDADQLMVTFQDRSTVPAKLIGRDPDNDLAVIQVDPNATDDNGQPIRTRLKPVTLGDSDRITIGETAIAIGSPLGLQQTVTEGIVSALRNPEEQTGTGDSIGLLGGAVQTDAAINPGNSGGPLFNASGEVIGVNSAILSQSGGNIGIGFAIPVNVVKRVVPELIQSGCYKHPLIGVTAISLSLFGQSQRQALGIPTNLKGLLVQDASAGAAQAGIQAGSQVVVIGGMPIRVGGDIIVAIDGRPVATGGELRGYVENNKHPGDTVTLTVLRGGQRQDIPVRLSTRPSDQPCR